MPGPTQSQNNLELIKYLSESTVEQNKTLYRLEEQVKNIAETVKECKVKIDALESKILIGNGKPSIMSRLDRHDEKIAATEEKAKLYEDSKRFWLSLMIPLIFTSFLSVIAITVQIVEVLWK